MKRESLQQGAHPLVRRLCPMCGADELAVHFHYDEPPPLETRFPLAEGQRYSRELHRCVRCGHLLEWFELDQSALYQGEYLSATYGDPEGIRRSFERISALPPERSDNVGRVRYILDRCARQWPPQRFSQSSPRLLDVGAGLGVFPFRMQQAGWQCIAIEMDDRYVAHHHERLGIESHLADIREVSGLGRFDLVTFNKVLEHVAEPIEMLASVQRLLAPGGLVYVELPDGEAAEPEGKEREEFLLGHIHVFSFASYALLVARAGLRLLSCERLREASGKLTLRGFAELNTMPAA